MKIEFDPNLSTTELDDDEIKRILEQIIEEIEHGSQGESITDLNGNDIGYWHW